MSKLLIDKKKVFRIGSEDDFNTLALEIFRFQAVNCTPYAEFLSYLQIDPCSVNSLKEIPYLPIRFFKSRKIYAAEKEPDIIFTSSGTTGMISSKHYIADLSLYMESFRKGFELFYGTPKDYIILALLPSYLERKGSSLVLMVDELISGSGNDSGFYLHNYSELNHHIRRVSGQGKKILLIGVTYALLDFAECYKLNVPDIIVMETGGMKGQREEITRDELHAILCGGLGVETIHSEYGMTELLSQAYSDRDGVFKCPPWMKVRVRDIYDPLDIRDSGKGGLNIVDLANIYSCSFIETEDMGTLDKDGKFTVMGRIDHSDIRGCNLLVD